MEFEKQLLGVIAPIYWSNLWGGNTYLITIMANILCQIPNISLTETFRRVKETVPDWRWMEAWGKATQKLIFFSLRWPPKIKLSQHKILLIYHSFKFMQYKSINIQIIKNQTWSNMWSNFFWQTQGLGK